MEWRRASQAVDYEAALAAMDDRAAAIHEGRAPELVWLLEHPPIYTAGTSANDADLIGHPDVAVHRTGRGGQYTYHGPGQRIAYVMLDLKSRQAQPDIKRYVWQLEEWIIRALDRFGVQGERRPGRVGIWLADGNGAETKIAAIGVRIRRWVTLHGIAINVDPDLTHFSGIVPCGMREHGVTSLRERLGHSVAMEEVDAALHMAWSGVFDALSSRPERSGVVEGSSPSAANEDPSAARFAHQSG